MNLNKIYAYALQREKEGFKFFSKQAEAASHSAARGIFQRLAGEEQAHIRYIEALIAAAEGGEGVTAPDLQGDGWFETRAQEEMLDQSLIESMVPDLAVLRLAYLIEKDLAEFYARAASQAEGAAREALTNLSNWEKAHERLFEQLHEKAFNEYADMPWGG